MSQMTIANLKTFAQTYVNKAKQAGAWSNSNANLYKCLDKIGKQITLQGNFQDKLPELDGDNLPLGKTIEEYFIELQAPVDWMDPTVAGNAGKFAEAALKPYLPSVGDVSYSYTLGRKVIPTTKPYDNVERAANDTATAANMLTDIMVSFENSYSLYKYACKKQLIGNMIDKAITEDKTAVRLGTYGMTVPSDSTTGEKFIKEVKKCVEDASFASDGNNLANGTMGATPEGDLILYVKKGVMPSLEVDTKSGAFQLGELAIPAQVKVIDDFGAGHNSVFAILVDRRGIKMHSNYLAVKAQENAFSDYVNFFRHTEATGFISKYTYVHIFSSAANAAAA